MWQIYVCIWQITANYGDQVHKMLIYVPQQCNKNNENVDIKYGSHDTSQESPVSKVIIVMFKYCNAVLVKSSQ